MGAEPGPLWDASTLVGLVVGFMLPFLRILALLMVAPVFGSGLVPGRVRILLAIGLAGLLVPVMPVAAVAIDTIPALVGGVIGEVLLGVTVGFMVQLAFDAVVIAGQAAANSMGLGFAVMVDPQRGVNVPILSQFLLIMATLVFLAIDGHLVLITVLAQSFETMPPGSAALGPEGFWAVVAWGSQMFAGAIRIALPAVIALLMVNIAYGVISRAAPTLNLFAVGIPVSLLLGILVLHYSFANMALNLTGLFDQVLQAARGLLI